MMLGMTVIVGQWSDRITALAVREDDNDDDDDDNDDDDDDNN